MLVRPFPALALCLSALMGCATADPTEPMVDLGNFALGLNVVVADNMQKVPISRDATVEEWEAAMKKAVDERFGRYQGSKLYNFGISVDAYALAPPGIPLIASPKSALVVTVTVWDDAAQAKLNEEGKQFTVFEGASAESAVLGSGLTRTKEEQMERLTRNAVKEIERWMLQNPTWFAIGSTTAVPPVAGAAVAGAPVVGAPLSASGAASPPPAGGVTTTPLPPAASN